jgi:hypothetical protein
MINSTPAQPWWNRPLWGHKTMLGRIRELWSRFQPNLVPADILVQHDDALKKLQILGKRATAIDDAKFSNQDFLFFVKMHRDLIKGDDEYQGLDEKVQLLKAAIEAKNRFTSLEHTEFRHQGTKQREYYQFVAELLNRNLQRSEFQDRIHDKFRQVAPELKTDEGKVALRNYVQDLEALSQAPMGLRLLSEFKRYQFNDYTVLQTVSNTITQMSQDDLQDFKRMIVRVMTNLPTFRKLSQVLGVAESEDLPGTYARILQYLSLSHKHKLAYIKFQELLTILNQWYTHYQLLKTIRDEYTAPQFIQPKTFKQELLGLGSYTKYKGFLT